MADRDLSQTLKHGAPWPSPAPDKLLFAICADNEFEKDLLLQWVEESWPQDGDSVADVAYSFIFVTGDSGRTRHEGISKNLNLDAERLVVPLGVDWLEKQQEVVGRPKFKDFLPRNIGVPTTQRQQKRLFRRNPERCALVAGEPGKVADLLKRYQSTEMAPDDRAGFADFVARQAVLTIERDRRNVPGAGLKLPRFVYASLLARRSFRERLQEIADAEGRDFASVETEAKDYMKELIPRSRPFFINLSTMLFRYFMTMAYEDKIVVDEASLERVRNLVRSQPSAIVWTHKTHVDGLAFLLLTREQDFPLTHVIGGINMAFAGMGQIMRRSGAIFIRRSFADNEVYKAVLRHYLGYVLEKNFPITWSLEGTRSRNGKLMPPRYGILKYVLEGAKKSGGKDLNIIPASIYYDLIPEIKDYAVEERGKSKRPESLLWFIQYLIGLRKPHGRIFISFGDPVIASDDVETETPDEEDDRFNLQLQKLAFEASVSINSVTPITGSGLIAFVLMGAAPQALTSGEVDEQLRELILWARARDLPMTDDFKEGTYKNLKAIADRMIEMDILTRFDEGPDLLYSVAADQQYTVGYYRNTVIHFFINNAIIELALVKAASVEPAAASQTFWDEALGLRDLFKFEFFYPPTDAFKAELERELDQLHPEWEADLRQGGQAVHGILASLAPLFAPGSLKSFAEGYRIVAGALLRMAPDAPMDEKSVMAACMELGPQIKMRGRITSEESIAKLMFSNGYKYALNSGLIDGEGDMAGRRVAFARQMRDLCARIQAIESLVLQRRLGAEIGITGVVDTPGAPQADQDQDVPEAPADERWGAAGE